MRRAIAGTLCCSLSGAAVALPGELALDIKGTSLAELMNLKITSLSRKQEQLTEAPAAVYVITHDMIQRMGVTHIAEALRYAPGVEVARLNASQWAISMRGFNARSANKLLVMIDGRSIYSPLFSGVLWEEKDLLLTDVDRIEVIRGPGGTQWGANAVNGVINVITKDARRTQGGLVTAGVGLEERGLLQSRYGFRVGERTYARVYGKYTRRDDSGAGPFGPDESEMQQAGFRADHHSRTYGHMTLQGDVYEGELGPEFDRFATATGEEYHGGNLQFDWEYRADRQRAHQVQIYFDRTHLNNPVLLDRRDVWSLDYQLLQRWNRHEVVAGVGYNFISDEIENSARLGLDPTERTDELRSAFIQDDISFLDNRLHLILGTKYESNDYSGEEWQPSVRASYALEHALVWAAWSRVTRTPTRLEHDFVQPPLRGAQTLGPEHATVYELGWRRAWQQRWQLDATTYLARYDDLMSIEPPNLGNEISGDVRGVELSLSVQPVRNWFLRLNASHAEVDVAAAPGSADRARALTSMGSSPKNMLSMMSLWDINSQWQLNLYLRYNDELPAFDVADYWASDVSVVWRPYRETRLQLVGRHLGDGEHFEWGGNTNLVEPDWAIYLTQEF